MDWNFLFFIISLSCGIICLIALVIDFLTPSFKVWPHKDGDTLGLIISLLLWGLFYFATLGLWIHNLFSLPGFTPLTWLGLFLFVGGSAFVIWAMIVLRIHVSLGVKGEQITHGPYRLCRNPQTTGLMIQLIGAVVMSLSIYMIILAVLHYAVLILAVIIEEPWLADQYGQKYEAYKDATPNRFVPHIGKLFSKSTN